MIIIYLQVGLLALAVLLLLLFRGYQKHIAPYAGFGSSFAVIEIVWNFITGGIPRNTTPSCYAFQLAIRDCKKYVSEGICVFWLPNPYVLVYNEEIVKTLSNSQAALNKPDIYHVLADGLGSGLITSDAELWQKRRKVFQPAFIASMIKNRVPDFNKNAALLVQRLITLVNGPVEITGPLKRCSLDNLLETVFGMNLENIIEKEEAEKHIDFFEKIGPLMAESMSNPLLHPKLFKPLFSSGRKLMKILKEGKPLGKKILLSIMDKVLEKNSNKATEEDDECFGTLRKSFAEILVQTHLQDPSFTVEDMNDENNTILAAGYETVSYSMMWCLFLLGNHQDIQDEVYNEVEHFMGDDISHEDVQNLTYTECVIKESLRLYPTIPLYGRRLTQDVQCGKYNMPEGTNIVICPYMLHRNPEIYPNPEKFDPERFRNNVNRNPWSFVPFAEGIRSCIGRKYAMIQMKITLAHLLQNFKVTSLQREEDIDVRWEVFLVPNQPIRLQFTPRRHISQQE